MAYESIRPEELSRLLRKARESGDSEAVAMLESRRDYLNSRNECQLAYMRTSERAALIFGMSPAEREAYWASIGLPFAGLAP